MFAIAIELLADRYTAMQFNDRNRAEWPPHPARLFSAMVAVWADSEEPNADERSALRWLEKQDAPLIRCGWGHPRRIVTHFVPVNDATALTRKLSPSYEAVSAALLTLRAEQAACDDKQTQRARAMLAKAEAKAISDAVRASTPTGRETASVIDSVLQVLPENRGRQGRTYPTILPEEGTVWFIWPDAVPGEQRVRVLDALLGRVGRIGHSSTLVSCRCVSEAPEPTWVPSVAGHGIRIRVPRTGSLAALEDAYAVHQGEEPRTLPSGTVYYDRIGVERHEFRSPLLGGDWYIVGFAAGNGRRQRLPSAVQALALARATRNALLSHGDQPSPAFISGHQESSGSDGPTPPLERPHLAIVPLPNAGNRYSDGAISGIALVLPSTCGESDKQALDRSLRSWNAAGFKLMMPARAGDQPQSWVLDELIVDRTDPGDGWLERGLPSRKITATREYWCRPARRWLTVTPIALDRFPGNLRSANSAVRERAETEAAESIARGCVLAGLVDRPDEIQVSVRLDAPLVGLPASTSGRQRLGGSQYYPGYRTGNGTPRACVHAELQFSEPVRGPVLIGSGRYFGYGLCLPRDDEGGQS